MYSPGQNAAFPDIMADVTTDTGDNTSSADPEPPPPREQLELPLTQLEQQNSGLFPDIPSHGEEAQAGSPIAHTSTTQTASAASGSVDSSEQSIPSTSTSDPKEKKDTPDVSQDGPRNTNTQQRTYQPAASLSESVLAGKSKRTDYRLVLSKTAIIVIDVQEYLSSAESTENLATNDVEKNNYLYNVSLPNATTNIKKLVNAIRKHRDDADQRRRYGCEVIFTYLEALTNDCRDVSLDYKLSGPKLSELPSPSRPAMFLSALQPSTSAGKGDILVPKTSCSVFNSTNMAYVLRNLQCEQILLVGQLTDQCVESAARDAADLGFFVTVVDDACAAAGTEEHAKGLSGMSGFARIMSTEQVLGEIEQAAADEARRLNDANACIKISYSDTKESPGADSATEPISATSVSAPSHPPDATSMVSGLSIKPAEIWQGCTGSASGASAIAALLRALRAAGVEFLRYTTLDVVNSIRCKAVPLSSIDRLCTSLDNRVSIAEVCFAGLPRYADAVVPETKLSAARVLVVKPHLETLRILPYAKASAICFGTVHDQFTGRLSPLCTRGLLARVMETARDDFGLAFHVGAEIEFSLFNDSSCGGSRGPVDSSHFGHATTLNEQEEFISALCKQLSEQEIDIELVHAESAAGQLEVILKYQKVAMRLADNVILARETIRACARAHGMRALFLPKIHASEAGNGMHLHFSFRDASSVDSNTFPHKIKAGSVSSRAGSFMEGILSHLPALLAITMPSINSFRRVRPGCWTGHDVRWAIEDKEAPIRVCLDLRSRQASNVEFKLFDSCANIYLGIASILAAGMNGIANDMKLRPAGASDDATCPPLPQSFKESIDCLKKDKLLQEVLGRELSTAYVALRMNEIEHYSTMSLDDEVDEAYGNA